MSFWPLVKKVVRDSDIVLLVLDARMPDLSRNAELEKMVKKFNKPLVFCFNKCDLIEKDSFFDLKRKYPNAMFVSGVKSLGISSLKKNLFMMAKEMKIDEPQIGIVGYPNVGKSAVINALAHSAKAVVSPKAGTTRNIQWIKAGGLKVLDSPGVIPIDDREGKLSLLSAKNPEKIRNLENAANNVIEYFLASNKKKLENHYNIKIEPGTLAEDIVLQIGKVRGCLVKGGNIDVKRAAMLIVRDWHRGRLKL